MKTNVPLPIHPSQVDKINLHNQTFKINDDTNKFRIKDCHLQHGTFSISLRDLDKYLQVPFCSITAFPESYDPNLNITASRTYKNSDTGKSDLDLRTGLWDQIQENDRLNETLATAKKEIEEIKNRNNTVSESNSEMAKQIQELKREYDSMKQKLTKELEEEKRYKNNFKKWNQTLSSENHRMQGIKSDLKHLQKIQVDIDVQRAEAIQMIAVLDKTTHEKLKKSLMLLLKHADYNDQMKYAKASLLNIERGTVKDRLSKIYYPSGDGGFENIPGWREKYAVLPWPVSPDLVKKAQKK